MSKLVSILIPAYNAERWIAAAIQSACDQTWHRTEVVVVDDGSTDNTLSIAKRFESRSVKVITQENRGAAAARNVAFSLAQGDYIQWLDADDLLAADKIANQIQAARQLADPKILVSSSFGCFHHTVRRARFAPSPLWADLNPVDWIITKFGNNWTNPAVWLVSRELTERTGPWNESLSLDDDGEYFCRLVARSQFVKFVPEARSYYRQWTAGSLSRTDSQAACESLFQSICLCIGHLRSLEDSPRTRRAALNYAQIWMRYFYPEKQELVQKLQQLADGLGGTLIPPTLTWEYRVISTVCGWEAAKRTRRAITNTKLHLRFGIDVLARHFQSR